MRHPQAESRHSANSSTDKTPVRRGLLRQDWSKVRRELRRISDQLAAIPAMIYEPLLQADHDRRRDSRLSVTQGRMPLGGKVAIYLVFQRGQLPETILECCAYLQRGGYSVLLVANGGLSKESLGRLSPNVWRVMERPNYGYDFGGYRDGILKLFDWGIHPRRLVILNDSIWLPVHDRNDPLALAETRDDTIMGLRLHTRGSKDDPAKAEPDGMIDSFFYSIPAQILQRPEFEAFWRKFRVSNAKARVIQRGEVGFSRAMRAVGIPVDGLCSRRTFLEAIRSQSPDFFRLALTFAAYVDDRFERRSKELLAEFRPDEDWRLAAMDHVTETVYRRQFNASFFWAADQLGLTNFMKKSREELFVRMQRAALSAVNDGRFPDLKESVLDELGKMQSGG